MRHIGVKLCFLWGLTGCTRSVDVEGLVLTPQELDETQFPAMFQLNGEGLTRWVSLSLDNAAAAKSNDLVVTFGQTQAAIIGRSARGITLSVDALEPGTYDLRVTTPAGGETVLSSALHVNAVDDVTVADEQTHSTTSVSSAPDATAADSFETSASSTPATSRNGDPTSAAEPSMSSGGTADSSGWPSGSFISSETFSDGSGAGADCADALLLFSDDYESGTLERWTSSDLTGGCHESQLDGEFSVSGTRAFHSDIYCSRSSDHENYAALQFAGDRVLDGHVETGLGIDAHDGVLIRFWARVDYSFEVNTGHWIALVLLSGSCDWSDSVLSLGLGNTSARLAVSHDEVNGGGSVVFPNAPEMPRGTWTRIAAYVNYHSQTLVVWQDGQAVTQANFVRPGKTLCHIRIGAYVSANTSDAQVTVDDPEIWKLRGRVSNFESEPCLISN